VLLFAGFHIPQNGPAKWRLHRPLASFFTLYRFAPCNFAYFTAAARDRKRSCPVFLRGFTLGLPTVPPTTRAIILADLRENLPTSFPAPSYTAWEFRRFVVRFRFFAAISDPST
jgi:hypothetical protein